MNKVVTRIQLVDGPALGYLEVKEQTEFPINYKIGDIRDLSSRSGSFSKTIKLAGTKNNNLLLNNYFDVNVKAGTFDVNKRQKCIVIQNDIIVLDNAYLRLLSVSKVQNRGEEIDNYVEYEVQVRDSLGDFFKEINNKELTQLAGWELYNHNYTKENVANSFSHTYQDGYKYVLPWIETNNFDIWELLPGIYAKQYWDRIHEQAGYEYEWDELSAVTTQFDKMIIPYSGDKKKLTEEYKDFVRVIAENTGTTQTGLGSANGPANISNIPLTNIELSNEIQDDQGYYNPLTSRYTSVFPTFTPNVLNWEITINFDVIMLNQEATDVELINPSFNTIRPILKVLNNANAVRGLLDVQMTSLGSSITVQNVCELINDNKQIRLNGDENYAWGPGETQIANCSATVVIQATNILVGDILRLTIDAISIQNAAFWRIVGTNSTARMYPKITVNSATVNISPNYDNGIIPGGPVLMDKLVPRKVKQSDFIKSIYQKYNLFAEIDPQDPNKIIYTSRDKYYDDGVLKDWTFKKHKNKEQTIQFVPEISTKKLILSYKDDDSDFYLKSYKEETAETYGQIEVEFDNENVKGVERKEEIFSPTINIPVDFGANLPILNADFKYNIRFLRDGGERPCGQYSITEYAGSFLNLSTFPFLSMLDEPTNPSFDISYAQPDYYAYNVEYGTENNLYTNHWRRTLAQINSGKLLTAYFWLTEEDINKLKLSDKIKVDNALWYINAVVDYDANARRPTKVELLSVEDDLRLPRFGRIVRPVKPGVLPAPAPGPIKPVGPIRPIVGVIAEIIRLRNSQSGVIGYTGAFIQGKNNIVPTGFEGIVLADNVNATENGIYIGDIRIDQSGNIINIRGTIIDGGVDVVYPFYKTDPIDILDGTIDAVRNVGGYSKARPIIDTNIIN